MPSQQLIQRHPDYVSLVQISDLHLSEQPDGKLTSPNFEAVVAMIQRDFKMVDLLAVTGDLLQWPSQAGYIRLFSQLDKLDIAYTAIAGNHDVTRELDAELPFEARRHIPVAVDSRLVNCYVTESQYWDIVWLDSSVSGKIAGQFSQQTLTWLQQTLEASDKPCIIFAHHPMAVVDSAWIDAHRLKNAEAFWQIVAPFAHRVQGIFVGHVHQENQLIAHGIALFTCPSTSVQFRPFCRDYTLDNLTAGLRWITLYNNGRLATGIKRLDTI